MVNKAVSIRSKFMNKLSVQKAKAPQPSIKDQIIHKLRNLDGQPFADPEKIVANIHRILKNNGCDDETINDAIENIRIEFVVHENPNELEISLHL